VSAGRLRQLAVCLGSVAEREGVTFVTSQELDALRESEVVQLLPPKGKPSAMLFGRDLFVLSQYDVGGWMVDAEIYADYSVTFGCDVEAEFAGVA
jgi:hypothetical protein